MAVTFDLHSLCWAALSPQTSRALIHLAIINQEFPCQSLDYPWQDHCPCPGEYQSAESRGRALLQVTQSARLGPILL